MGVPTEQGPEGRPYPPQDPRHPQQYGAQQYGAQQYGAQQYGQQYSRQQPGPSDNGQGQYGQGWGRPDQGGSAYGQSQPGQPGQPQHGQQPGQTQYGQQYGQTQYGQQYGQPQYGQAGEAQYGRHQAGQQGQAQYGATLPGAGPGTLPAPAPPAKPSSAGKIVAIVVGVVVVVLVLGGIAVYNLFSGVSDRVGGLADGLTGGLGTDCAAVPTAEVNAALGGTYDVIQLGGIGDLAAPVLDSRVLADAPTCWAVESGSTDAGGRLARIARYSGPDAAVRFATEKATAMGTSEDRGGGITVSSDGYFAGDVQAGDEAFCTSGDFLGSAGALVRRGDLLIYVSTTAASDGAAGIPQIDLEAGQLSFGTDEANCALAVAVAAKAS